MDDLPAVPYPKPTPQVAPYVEVLGFDLAIAFLMQFGGAELYIAKDPKGRGQLEALVGPDRVKALGAIDHRLQRRGHHSRERVLLQLPACQPARPRKPQSQDTGYNLLIPQMMPRYRLKLAEQGVSG